MHKGDASPWRPKAGAASPQCKYALADMSKQLFVSRYQVQLPDKAEMAAFLHKAVEELGGGDE